MQHVTVCEYDYLVQQSDAGDSRCHQVSKPAFDWLLKYGHSQTGKNRDLIRATRISGQVALQVINFVGVMDTPCGTRIEILPKTVEKDGDIEVARRLLLKMFLRVNKLPLEMFHNSHLKTVNRPLMEVLISQFLITLRKLVKRGIRSDYRLIEEECAYLKGQLQVSKQVRQRPGKLSHFYIAHDEYLLDRPENRLLHSALICVSKWSRTDTNQRMARELLFVFNEIPGTNNIENDLKQWRNDRSMIHYRPLKMWCELILRQQNPLTLLGGFNGVSFLIPMEKLFEKYVALTLQRQLPSNLKLKEQVQSESLSVHNNSPMFKLKPDIVIYENSNVVSVMDTKWKRVDEYKVNNKDKYDLSQSDFYQLYAYGEKYMDGVGDIMLIYPKWSRFTKALDVFELSSSLRLWVVPFDLNLDSLCFDNWQSTIFKSKNIYGKAS